MSHHANVLMLVRSRFRLYICYIVLLHFLEVALVSSRKLRTWCGPDFLVSGNPPQARSLSGVASIASNIYVYGGLDGLGNHLEDFYRFDTSALSWMDITQVAEGPNPGARAAHGAVAINNTMIIFGGQRGSGEMLNDTFQFDSVSLKWTDLSDVITGVGPTARVGFSLAVHESSVYMFGGKSQDDTTDWVWTNLTSIIGGTNPTPREGVGFIFHKTSLFVFGGWFINISFGIDVSQPLDVVGEHMNDLYELDLNTMTWRNLSDSLAAGTPSPRSYHSFWAFNNRLFVYGGWTGPGQDSFGWVQPTKGSYFDDLFVYDLELNEWNDLRGAIKGPSLPARAFSALSIINQSMYTFGGFDANGNNVNDLLVLLLGLDTEPIKWSSISSTTYGQRPPERDSHGFVYLKDTFFTFAGRDTEGNLFDDLHRFDIPTLTWTGYATPGNSTEDTSLLAVGGDAPAPRCGFGMASDETSIFVSSGMGESVMYGDLFRFDPSMAMWERLTSSGPGEFQRLGRCYHSLIYSRSKLYIFGGAGEAAVLNTVSLGRYYGWLVADDMNDVIQYDIEKQSWANITLNIRGSAPKPRNSHAVTLLDGMMYVFGGQSAVGDSPYVDMYGVGFLNDLFMLDLGVQIWTDLSPIMQGTIPDGRYGHSMSAAKGKLFVFAGYAYPGFDRNEIFQLELSTMIWTTIHPLILGSPPTERDSGVMITVSDKIYIYGGQGNNGLDLTDLWSFDSPKEVRWPEMGLKGFFLDIYDWDTIDLSLSEDNVLPARFQLCSGVLPCTLSLTGKGVGNLELTADGGFSCLGSMGCSHIFLTSLRISCTDASINRAVVESEGALLMISNSTIEACSSQSDGGAVQAYGGGQVKISDSQFLAVSSVGFGGAISSFGSDILVSRSTFRNCSASKGGGSIVASDFVCYESKAKGTVSVMIQSCIFQSSFSPKSGGAISLVSNAALVNVTVESSEFRGCSSLDSAGAIRSLSNANSEGVALKLSSTHFRDCHTKGYGGCVQFSSNKTKIIIVQSSFEGCISESAGGAVAVEDFASCQVFDSFFQNNSASGLGGGAMFSADGILSFGNLSCVENSAPQGGGGVMLWDGSIIPQSVGSAVLDSEQTMCGFNNLAAYGNCMASTYKSLSIVDLANSNKSLYAGVRFSMRIQKEDWYEQIISSDSSSLVQVKTSKGKTREEDPSVALSGTTLATFEKGIAYLSLAIEPLFTEIDFDKQVAVLKGLIVIYADSSDYLSSRHLQSDLYDVPLQSGRQVCPRGYILVLGNSRAGVDGISATCLQCGPGTYSINPFRGYTASSASCFNCPVKFICLGGDQVQMAPLGDWSIDDGFYRLMGCPPGHQFLNAINGLFSHDVQQCIPCAENQYIIDSKNANYTCQDCPLGAECDGQHLSGMTSSVWEADLSTGQYILKSCPAGYEIQNGAGSSSFSHINQACVLCPAAYYCVGGSSTRTQCSQGLFSLPGSSSVKDCISVLYVEVTVTLPVQKNDFSALQESLFARAMSATTGAALGRIIILSITQMRRSRRTSQASLTIVSEIAADDKDHAMRISESLSQIALNSNLAKLGLPDCTISTVTVLTQNPGQSYQNTIVLIGGIVGAFIGMLMFILTAYLVWDKSTAGASRRLIGAQRGELANQRDLPRELRKKYEAVRVLGCGSSGVVLEAWQLNNGKRNVRRAIKLIHSRHRQFSAKEIRRLEREGHIISRLKTSNIVSFVESSMSNTNDVFWIVVEFLNGPTLKEMIASEPVPELEVIKIGLEMCMALKALHGMGVIHRDVKPANIIKCIETEPMISASGDVGFVQWRKRLSGEISKKIADALAGLSGTSPSVREDDPDVHVTVKEDDAQAEISAQRSLIDTPTGSQRRPILRNMSTSIHGSVTDSATTSRRKLIFRNDAHGDSVTASRTASTSQGQVLPGVFRSSKSTSVLHSSNKSQKTEATFKLIDLGTAIGLKDVLVAEESSSLATVTENEFVGTPAYASPECFVDPSAVSFPADVWSLTATLFHLLSGKLPFPCATAVEAANAISGDLDSPATDVRDAAPQNLRSSISSSLAAVIAKGLEKRQENRFQSVDEMATALHGCLVQRGEDVYTAFISYRVFSEKYHAALLYEVLNNTVTPGGHRVIIYLDQMRMVKGEDWEEDFSSALLNSMVALPLLTEGVLRPLSMLNGTAADKVDNVLRELMMMLALRGNSAKLEAIYPILIGRPCNPQGDNNLAASSHGNFFKECEELIQRLPSAPSQATVDAARSFLDQRGISVSQWPTVRATVDDVLSLQSAQLWAHPGALVPEEIEEDARIVRQMRADPPDPPLTLEQLCLLKAELRAVVPSIHEVIDRAWARSARRLRRLKEQQDEAAAAHGADGDPVQAAVEAVSPKAQAENWRAASAGEPSWNFVALS